MFKPTQCLQARLRLTTKQVNGGYYKGNRTGSMGHFGRKKGKYYIDWTKVRTYVVPESLSEFKLTPFVTKRMEPTKTKFTKTIEAGGKQVTLPRAYSGQDFLNEWNDENIQEVDELKLREEEMRNKPQASETEEVKSENKP